MAIQKRFNVALDIKRPSSNQPIEVIEGDNSNVFDITLTDNGQIVALTGCLVTAVFSKSNGKVAIQDSNGHGITISNNVLEIELYAASFAPGLVECEVQIFSGPSTAYTQATSAKFNFMCRRAIANPNVVEKTDEWPILVGLIGDVNTTMAALAVHNSNTVAASQGADAAKARADMAAAAADNARETATAAEAARVTAENARVVAENSRSAVNTAHEAAEQTRQAQENTRQAQEQTRQTDTSAAIVRTDAAKQRAIDAAKLAQDVVNGKLPAHAATHAIGGTDQLSPADIGASPAVHTHAMGDITALGAALDAKAAKSTTLAATLTSAGWTGASAPYVQTVNVTGVTAAMNPIVDVVSTAAADIAAWGCVSKIETGAGTITATCYESKPETNINFTLLEVN